MTTAKPTVIEAWSNVMDDVQAIKKNSVNQQQHFNFRGIDAVMNAVGPVLRKHGVVVVPKDCVVQYRDVTYGARDTKAREATVVATYEVFGPAGDSFTMKVPAEALDSGDKATSKAMSVAYRTALLQGLTIPTDEPDPDEATYERSANGENTANETMPPLPPGPAQPDEQWYIDNGWPGGQEEHDALKAAAKEIIETLSDGQQKWLLAEMKAKGVAIAYKPRAEFNIFRSLVDQALERDAHLTGATSE